MLSEILSRQISIVIVHLRNINKHNYENYWNIRNEKLKIRAHSEFVKLKEKMPVAETEYRNYAVHESNIELFSQFLWKFTYSFKKIEIVYFNKKL